QLHALASTTPYELPLMLSNRSDPIECRLVVYAKARQGRRSPNRRTPSRTSRSTASKKASAREREPWLIVASPELEAPSARQLVNLYAR
ncbi:IS4 family transposase, partial [Bacillus sp. SIMBA_005]